jgi:drug/metabolite transporter (DMT)-like permease
MSGVAIVTFNRAVSLLGSAAATAIIALLLAIATLLAIPVLGEVPVPAEILAIVAIVIGVLLAARPTSAGRPPPAHLRRREPYSAHRQLSARLKPEAVKRPEEG